MVKISISTFIYKNVFFFAPKIYMLSEVVFQLYALMMVMISDIETSVYIYLDTPRDKQKTCSWIGHIVTIPLKD